MMHARTRRGLVDQMVHEYSEELVRSLIETIVTNTGKSYIEAADIVLMAWQRSKQQRPLAA